MVLTQYLPKIIQTTDGTYLPWLLLICFIVFPTYWAFYGFLFSHWKIDFKSAMLWGNIPIYFDTGGEILYYIVFGHDGSQYPLLAFILGSHIDKINLYHLFGFDSIFLSIIISMGGFLLFFCLGYSFDKK